MSHVVQQPPATYNTTIRRFEPAFWDVDFDISSVATVVTTGPDAFTVKGILRTLGNLVGVFWRSHDKWGHPLFSYKTNVDWTNCTLAFDLTYTGCPTINDSANAGQNRLTMTVHDISGKPYYVYLMNYMTSGSANSRSGSFSLSFPSVFAGINADEPIPWDRIDNIFIGFVPPGYAKGTITPIADLAFEAVFTNLSVTGANATVPYNNSPLSVHGLRIADGLADSYPLTPARVVEQVVNLGYSDHYILYVGFTQFLSLTWNSGENRFIIDAGKPFVNAPVQQWVSDLAARLKTAGFEVTVSVSFELLKMYTPTAWAQFDANGLQSESGWAPSSTFVSPCSSAGMNYLRDVAKAFVGLCVGAGATTIYQVGEPWWWPGEFGGGPCFYDNFTEAAYTSETGNPVPTPKITSIYDDFSSPQQTAFVNWLNGKLGSATLWLAAQVQATYPSVKSTVLFYTPTITNPITPLITAVNFPVASWSHPAFDFVQVEDYEVVEFGNFKQQLVDLDVPNQSLAYSLSDSEYFVGFNLLPETTFIWDNVDKAIWQAMVLKGYTKIVVWARPQICRDGWVFDTTDFPDYAQIKPAPVYTEFPNISTLGWSVTRTPIFESLISQHVDGREIRSPRMVYPRWQFELTYEYLDSKKALTYQSFISFFQAMRGRDGRFAFTDPENNTVTAHHIGTGDGYRTTWPLSRPVGTIYEEPVGAVKAINNISINGTPTVAYSVWYNDGWPSIKFDSPPVLGATITASFKYQFVCRFVNDQMTFEEFMAHFHNLRSCQFITVKP